MLDRLLAATLIAATLPLSAYAQTAPGTPPSLQASPRSRLPLVFEPNRGQADPRARFVARGPGYGVFLTDDDAVMSLRGSSKQVAPVRMRLVGASRSKGIEGLEPTGGVSSYFRGNDPRSWRAGIPHYRKVRYQAVYPGVDEVFYGNGGRMEYDLIVAPGADASRIEVEYQGPKSIRIDDTGDLVLLTDAGDLRIRRPKVYQQDKGGNRTEVAASFRLSAPNRATFLLARYDARRELVIDPAVEYSTYLGGGNNENGYGIAVDSSGNAYVAGYTGSSDFPATPGAFQPNVASLATGYGDAFIAKFNATGTKLIYATYLGGTFLDQANAIAVDSAGNAYVTGMTISPDFPVQNALQPRKTSPSGHNVAFVTKLNASGTGLIYSTYLGGTATDQGNGIAVDASGNALVTGTTTSTDFPVQNAFQPKLKSINFQGSSAFVTKISADGGTFIYSTFLGGSNNDIGSAIAIDAAGDAYVVGHTPSADFPTKNAFQPVNGNGNAFLTKLNPGGSALIYSTFLGGGGNDGANAVAVDPTGAAYVTGYANSNDFPTKKALFPTLMQSPGAFVAKFAPTGSLAYSTFITGANPGVGIAADAAGNAYITGFTRSAQFPVKNAIQPNITLNDADYVIAFSPDGSSLLYSTYLGGGGIGAGAIASDAAGNVYVTGGESSPSSLPTDMSAFQTSIDGPGDVFVVAISSGAGLPLAVVNGASFAGQSVAPNSIASAFGKDVGTQTASSGATLGTSLGGTTVNITDSNMSTLPAPLFAVTPGQVNLLVPAGTALGAAQVSVTSGDGVRSMTPIQIANVAPGIFTADGKLAVGSSLHVDAAGNQTSSNLVQYNSAALQFAPVPINLGAAGDSTYLIFYGTGIRDALLSQVTVTIGGQTVNPLFAGIQGQFQGLDQINLIIPHALAGAGDVAVTLTAAGVTSNAVHVTIQ